MEIFAEPNGGGKTTISEIVLRDRKNAIFFHSDRIAGGLAPVANDAVQFEAGRFMIESNVPSKIVKRRLERTLASPRTGVPMESVNGIIG